MHEHLKLPAKILRAVHLLHALNLKQSLTLIKDVLYLYREFYIKTEITPKVEEYKVCFWYKDKWLEKVVIKDPTDLRLVIQKIKETVNEIESK